MEWWHSRRGSGRGWVEEEKCAAKHCELPPSPAQHHRTTHQKSFRDSTALPPSASTFYPHESPLRNTPVAPFHPSPSPNNGDYQLARSTLPDIHRSYKQQDQSGAVENGMAAGEIK
jgi:hypothetical protein